MAKKKEVTEPKAKKTKKEQKISLEIENEVVELSKKEYDELVKQATEELTKENLTEEEIKEINKVKRNRIDSCNIYWDVLSDEEILFFDSNLSYQLTGYRPIDGTHGLDFKVEWFTAAKRAKKSTGKYCPYPFRSKAYDDFWKEEYRRCRDGLTVNGYTLTGDNYYFINYYQLPNLSSATKAGQGRSVDFPNFYVKQYEYFHYIELCKVLKRNAIGLKARGVGFSEIGASIAVNTYSCRPQSRSVVTANQQGYVEDFLNKCWLQLNYLDEHTEGGFKKLRQVHNNSLKKRASARNADKVEVGWMAEIEGIPADKPNKIRGDRTDYLVYEESGSWLNWEKAFIQGDALIDIQGQRFGIKCAWGTGGDSGPALEGLANAYYNPNTYDALPYKHNYTEDGSTVITCYFVPSYTMVTKEGYVDERGWTDPVRGREYYESERKKKMSDPKVLLLYSAEYCFTAEEALALEGDNQFNSVLLSEQLTNIKLHKLTPEEFKPKRGRLEYKFKGEHSEDTKDGIRFIEDNNSKIVILEHPLVDEDGNPYRDLYVSGIDSIDLGMEETSVNTKDPSDFCLVVKRRAFGLREPMYVCVYKDRPKTIEEAYRNALKILEYYNCQAVLESTKISILTWFRGRKKENKYLMRRPRAAQSDIQRGASKQFGVQATPHIIQHQLDLIDSYINDFVYNIWYEPMLEECIKYSYENKRKFDIIAAMGMCELGDEELSQITPKPSDKSLKNKLNMGYWVDERGVRRFGRIPSGQQYRATSRNQINTDDDRTRIRTSDPRLNR